MGSVVASPPRAAVRPHPSLTLAERRRRVFERHLLPYLLVAPQILVTLVFFIWPSAQAVMQSVTLQDAFGFSVQFVWFENFTRLLGDPDYLHTLEVTAIFSFSTAILALSASLLLAVMADRAIRGAIVYKTFLIAPYAVAPAIAGVLWLFMFDPTLGVVARLLRDVGVEWNHRLNGNQAMVLVVIAATWKQISYNFVFFLAGLQMIPKSLIEAAAIDGAGPVSRFWRIVLPLLSPTAFFLIVVNIVYAFFDTFGIIHTVTSGGPARATETLVYKVFNDGFIGLNLGSSAAQSVILMSMVMALTVVQFRYLERRVHY